MGDCSHTRGIKCFTDGIPRFIQEDHTGDGQRFESITGLGIRGAEDQITVLVVIEVAHAGAADFIARLSCFVQEGDGTDGGKLRNLDADKDQITAAIRGEDADALRNGGFVKHLAVDILEGNVFNRQRLLFIQIPGVKGPEYDLVVLIVKQKSAFITDGRPLLPSVE